MIDKLSKHFFLITTILFLFLTVFPASGQVDNAYLKQSNTQKINHLSNLKPDIKIDNRAVSRNEFLQEKEIQYMIPVKFRIYKSKNLNAYSDDYVYVQNQMDILNNFHAENNTGFRFYLRPDIEFVHNDRRLIMGYFFEAFFQTLFHHSKDAVNIFVVKNLKKRKGGKNALVRGTYNKLTNSVILKSNTYSSTLTHELGHFFGLKHTHRHYDKGKYRQEAVSRARTFKGPFRTGRICEKNGDGICDTPAEPLMLDLVDIDCNYLDTIIYDNWGDIYKPSTNNIMSYPAFRKCRNNFTSGQISMMQQTARNKDVKGWYCKADNHNKSLCKYFADVSEPDDFKEMARLLTYDSTYYHTFHGAFMGKNEEPVFADTDWKKIIIYRNINHLKFQLQKGKVACEGLRLQLFDEQMNLLFENFTQPLPTVVIYEKNIDRGKYFLKIDPVRYVEKNVDFYITLSIPE